MSESSAVGLKSLAKIVMSLSVFGLGGVANADEPIVLDLDTDASRQVIVDREPGQYLGHPTTVLLEDGKTILCVYPKGHGRGAIVYKRRCRTNVE
jgi:hypothetical protein